MRYASSNILTSTFDDDKGAILHKVARPFYASSPHMLAPASLLLKNPLASAWAIVVRKNLANGPAVIPIPTLSSVYPPLPPG
ncbi:hypothetical protein PTTG_03504, partial [Puccinia triticina 1-1 BBBD Race 1]